MKISYLGRSCFKLEVKAETPTIEKDKLEIIFDPFPASLGLKPPVGDFDLVLISHDHSDHNAKEQLKKGFFLINGPGEYTYQGASVLGINTFHDAELGTVRGSNTVYKLETEGLKICHLGDLGCLLEKKQIDLLGEIDVLMIPVGGKYTLGPKEAVETIKMLEPTFIVPMHFSVPGLKIDDLEPVSSFYRELGMEPVRVDKKFVIKKNGFVKEEIKLLEFTD
jgi:L-ascorbate metabolism protein UlaG (beta-lactamase superfamily)